MVSFSLPGYNELPPLDHSVIQTLFKKVKLRIVIGILKCLCQGESVRLIGTKRSEISSCCEAIRSLLFPLRLAPSKNKVAQYNTY